MGGHTSVTGGVVPGGLQVAWVPPLPGGHSVQSIGFGAAWARAVFGVGTAAVFAKTCSRHERDGMMGTPTPTGGKGAGKAGITSLVKP